MSTQQEFLFIDGPADTPGAGATSSSEERIIEEIRAAWRLPFVRQKVRVALRGCDVCEMNGLLEIAEPAPDYPFDAAKPLRLRIDGITFAHTQIISCVLL